MLVIDAKSMGRVHIYKKDILFSFPFGEWFYLAFPGFPD